MNVILVDAQATSPLPPHPGLAKFPGKAQGYFHLISHRNTRFAVPSAPNMVLQKTWFHHVLLSSGCPRPPKPTFEPRTGQQERSQVQSPKHNRPLSATSVLPVVGYRDPKRESDWAVPRMSQVLFP